MCLCNFKNTVSANGKFKIESQKSQCFEVTNFRHMLMLGVRPTKINFGRELEFHKLTKKGYGVLTSDAPIEIYTQWIAFKGMKGNVLVGGLGLGMAATMILKMPNVTGVTVVEKEKQIIDLVGPQLDKRIRIIHADLYQYLRQLPGCCPYESAYHDIWYRTGEGTWAEDVVPLYRLSRKAGIKNLGAWGEHEMRDQIVRALYSRTLVPDEASEWKPYRVFMDGLKSVLGGEPPYGPEHEPMITKMIKLYVGQVGSPRWEKLFKWDAPTEVEKAA